MFEAVVNEEISFKDISILSSGGSKVIVQILVEGHNGEHFCVWISGSGGKCHLKIFLALAAILFIRVEWFVQFW